MKALISPEELTQKYDRTILGSRIAQVAQESFDVAPPLFWVDCVDDVVADQFYYSENGTIEKVPLPPEPVMNNSEPTVI